MLKNRLPYDAEVAKKYQRLHDEKRKVRPDHGREIEFIRTRVSDLECSVHRLGDDMEATHKRLKEMMQSLLHKVVSKEVDASDDMQESASKLVETPMLTSTTAEAKTVPLEPAPTPLLNVVRVVDVPSTSTLVVGSDVITDVAADATLNKAAKHASVNTDIGTVVEDIRLKEGTKSVIADVIAEFIAISEDVVDDAIAQSGVKNDDGHGVGEEIVVAADDNVVDRVSQI